MSNASFKSALRACRKVGCAHATGDGLRAMYAETIPSLHGGNAEAFYRALCRLAPGDDAQITEQARILLRDRAAAWDELLKQTERAP